MLQPVRDQPDHSFVDQTSRLQRLWEGGGLALTLQLPPLLTADAADCMRQLAAYRYDAVLAADAPDGAVAISSMALAVLLKRMGIEAIVQISGRDRNRLALQGDLLGLSALGIHNLLFDLRPVTRASLGQNADARLVTDLNGPALLSVARQMRDEGRFMSGASIKKRPVFYAGAFFSLEERVESAALSGVQFVVTPPVYDVQRFLVSLAAFQTAHPGIFSTRPLLASLPLTTTDALVASIRALKGHEEIRGFNIVAAGQNDLAALEQVPRMVAARR